MASLTDVANSTQARLEAIGTELVGPRTYDRSSLVGDFLVTLHGQTPQDWERLAPEMPFCEYIDGVVYMPSPVSDRHQEITLFVYELLSGFRYERGLGSVLTGPAVLRLAWNRMLEPDIFVRPTPEQAQPGSPYGDVRAVLVVEVLSPSNRGHDLEHKAAVYREAGIPEVWFIDHSAATLHADRRVGTRYERTEYPAGVVASQAIAGFGIDLSWLWADPAPNPRRCLEAILAGPGPAPVSP